MISNDDYKYDESQTDYISLHDGKGQTEDCEYFDQEAGAEFQPEQVDLQGLEELYYEHCGSEFPKQYKDYANKAFINEAWGSITCSVVKTLNDIGWKSMSSEDRRAFFELIAAYAKTDEQYYKDNYYHIVYAILYQIVWAEGKKLRSDEARVHLDDIVEETLIKISSNTELIGRYDPTYSPITYLCRLATTSVLESYYQYTDSKKRTTTIRRDADAIKDLLKKSPNYNEHLANSTGFLQLFMEIKRSQNPPAHTEIDNFLHSLTYKALDYKEDLTGMEDAELDAALEQNTNDNSDNDEVIKNVKKILSKRYHDKASEL